MQIAGWGTKKNRDIRHTTITYDTPELFMMFVQHR
jgi:hypothetical protein